MGEMDQATQVIGKGRQGNRFREKDAGHNDKTGREEGHEGVHVCNTKESQPSCEAVSCNDMRVQGIWGESKVGNEGGTRAWMGMVGHQRQERNASKGGGIGKEQVRWPR